MEKKKPKILKKYAPTCGLYLKNREQKHEEEIKCLEKGQVRYYGQNEVNPGLLMNHNMIRQDKKNISSNNSYHKNKILKDKKPKIIKDKIIKDKLVNDKKPKDKIVKDKLVKENYISSDDKKVNEIFNTVNTVLKKTSIKNKEVKKIDIDDKYTKNEKLVITINNNYFKYKNINYPPFYSQLLEIIKNKEIDKDIRQKSYNIYNFLKKNKIIEDKYDLIRYNKIRLKK